MPNEKVARHSPSPWTCDENGIIRDARKRVVAQMSRASNDACENVANGFLVELAPEMAEMLRDWPVNMPAAEWNAWHARRRALLARLGEG